MRSLLQSSHIYKNYGILIKSNMMWRTSVYGIVLSVGIILISCNQRKDPVNKNSFESLKAVDTKTLVSMISRLNQALAVKDYSADKGIAVLKPLTSTYKVCIPGFTKMVPYDESYLYIYCIYDTKETPPRVLSFRFQLPRSLAQNITMSDIRKPFQKWEKENTFKNPDHKIIENYKINEGNTTIGISKHVLPNQTDGMITEVTLYR